VAEFIDLKNREISSAATWVVSHCARCCVDWSETAGTAWAAYNR